MKRQDGKSANEKEFITDEYTYYYTENDKNSSTIKYILYLKHPIELLDLNGEIRFAKNKEKVMCDGIKLDIYFNFISDNEIIELYKKMIPEIDKSANLLSCI